jgi:signal transduction histidine kinase
MSNCKAVTKKTFWQRYGYAFTPATGALIFACVLNGITIWRTAGALGPWLAFIGLSLALIAMAAKSKPLRELLVPTLLGLAALGLGLFSGGLTQAAASVVLWPILGNAALGGRLATGVSASLCTLVMLLILNWLISPALTDALIVQSGISALGVSGAFAVAACVTIATQAKDLVSPLIAEIDTATAKRDEALAQAQEARNQTQGRAQFLAEMSHEIRTPLNAILGFADTMREGVFGPLPQAYGDYPGLIHTSGTHLLDLVSDLLDLSKIEAGRYETHLRAVNLDDIAYEGVRLSSGAAQAAGVQIRHEAKGGVEVIGDPRALRQIIFNLMSNAIKFTPRGGRVSLRVLLDKAANLASLEVEDDGVGINSSDLAKIGEPWNQGSKQSDGDMKKSRGSGLGLALVKRLTDLQGGTFEITSAVGIGTRARVSFKLAPVLSPIPKPQVAA